MMSNKIKPYTSIKMVYKKFHISERSHFVYKGIYNMHIKTTTTRINVVKSSRLLVKITAYLGSIGWLLCLSFLYGWRFLKKISLDWLLILIWQPGHLLQNFLTTLRMLMLKLTDCSSRVLATIELFFTILHRTQKKGVHCTGFPLDLAETLHHSTPITLGPK